MSVSSSSSAEALRSALHKYFGYDAFLADQEEATSLVYRGKDCFVNLATGAGKSLCYQLPALLLDDLVVVVSPLIALMHDQVDALEEREIAAVYLDSSLDDEQKAKNWQRVRSGEVDLLYTSPEHFATETFIEQLGDTKVARLIVDEAHCVSMWGHDFRREFLSIRDVRKRIGNPPLAAFTATAPVLVREDILESLEIPDAVQVIGEMDRKNLIIDIERFYGDFEKWQWLRPKLIEHARAGHKAIVFCRKISTVKELAASLEHRSLHQGTRFEIYHGKMESEDRTRVENAFRAGKIPILIATKAFGMGVDVPDVRYVYHYALPESLEEYWQEIGRAGRDGHRSWCTLLYQPRDVAQLRRFIAGANPKLSFINKIWAALTQRVERQEWRKDVPSRFFVERRFVSHFAGEDDMLASLVRAALAQIFEHGMARKLGNRLEILIKPEVIKRFGFPIDENTLETKRDAAMLRLKVMIYYAQHGKESPRRIVMGHFLHNTVADQVRDMDVDAWYQLQEKELLVMCRAIAEREMNVGSFPGYLGGRNQVQGPFSGKLKKFNPRELKLDVHQAQILAYLRAVQIGDTSYLTLTPKGVEFLTSKGRRPKAAKTYAELRQCMYSPVNKPILVDAIEDWWSIVKGRHAPRRWWELIEEFMFEQEFQVLNSRVSGLKLVAHYMRKTAKFAATHKQAGVRKSDAKSFLNYLTGNAIET